MKSRPDSHYRHRFPAEIISHAVWLYHVFSLSLRDCELLLRPSQTWEVLHRRTKRTIGPALGGGVIALEGPVHYRGSYLEHALVASRRPAHLLLLAHPLMQQPLHRALGGCCRDRFQEELAVA
jgi:hypothetical protein